MRPCRCGVAGRATPAWVVPVAGTEPPGAAPAPPASRVAPTVTPTAPAASTGPGTDQDSATADPAVVRGVAPVTARAPRRRTTPARSTPSASPRSTVAQVSPRRTSTRSEQAVAVDPVAHRGGIRIDHVVDDRRVARTGEHGDRPIADGVVAQPERTALPEQQRVLGPVGAEAREHDQQGLQRRRLCVECRRVPAAEIGGHGGGAGRGRRTGGDVGAVPDQLAVGSPVDAQQREPGVGGVVDPAVESRARGRDRRGSPSSGALRRRSC